MPEKRVATNSKSLAATSGNSVSREELIDINVPSPKAESKSLPASENLGFRGEYWNGPLPPPQLLNQYGEAIADRIVKMAEDEAKHRREMERCIVEAQVESDKRDHLEARRGQVCATIIALAFLVAATYCAMYGHQIAASVIGASGISGIVTTFIIGRRQTSPEAESPPQKQQSDAPTPKSQQRSGRRRPAN